MNFNSESACTKCRLCLFELNHLNPIFETGSNTNSERPTKVSMCTYTKIESGDGLPNTICDSCLLFVECWDTFRLKCKAASEYFYKTKNKKDDIHQKDNICEADNIYQRKSAGNNGVNFGNLIYIHVIDSTDQNSNIMGVKTTLLQNKKPISTVVENQHETCSSSKNDSNNNYDNNITSDPTDVWRAHLEDLFTYRKYYKGNNGERLPTIRRSDETTCYSSECQTSFNTEEDSHMTLHKETLKVFDVNLITKAGNTINVSTDAAPETFIDGCIKVEDIVNNLYVDNNLNYDESVSHVQNTPQSDQNYTKVNDNNTPETLDRTESNTCHASCRNSNLREVEKISDELDRQSSNDTTHASPQTLEILDKTKSNAHRTLSRNSNLSDIENVCDGSGHEKDNYIAHARSQSLETSDRTESNTYRTANKNSVLSEVANISVKCQSGYQSANTSLLKNTNFFCERCNKMFNNSGDHIRYIADNPTDYSKSCVVCWKSFNSKEELKVHKLNHKDERFPCKHCHKIYTKKSHWQKHKAVHNKKKKRDMTKDKNKPTITFEVEILYDKKVDFDPTSISTIEIDSSDAEDNTDNVEQIEDDKRYFNV